MHQTAERVERKYGGSECSLAANQVGLVLKFPALGVFDVRLVDDRLSG